MAPGFEHGSITSQLRAWASESPFTDLAFTSILIADNLNDVEPLIAASPQTTRVRVPLPDQKALEAALGILAKQSPRAFAADAKPAELAGALAGVTVSSLESLVKVRHHESKPLGDADLARLKKELVERDSAGLVEFIEAKRTLNDYHGQEALKTWLRQDIVLWRKGDLKALPMGYLLCGPVGTGKTFLVECLAGEAGVPVVKLKNFRDRWVGSSEGNLEKIFRLVRALGRCMVFIDEADQTLGKRDSGSGDSGPVGTHLLDDRAGDVGQRQSRPRAVAARLLAPRSHRGRPQTSGPRRRQSTVVTHQHHRRERAAHRPAREALWPRAHARGSDPAGTAHAHAAHARRRRGAGGQGVSSLAHAERRGRRGPRSQSRRLPEPGAGRRAGIPDAYRGA